MSENNLCNCQHKNYIENYAIRTRAVLPTNNLFFVLWLACPQGWSFWRFYTQDELYHVCLQPFLHFLHSFPPCFSTAAGRDSDCFQTVAEEGNSELWWRTWVGGVARAAGGPSLPGQGKQVFSIMCCSQLLASVLAWALHSPCDFSWGQELKQPLHDSKG